MKAVLALAFVAAAHGHGTMVKPTTWFDAGGKFGQGLAWLQAGCTGKAAPGQLEKAQGCAGEWYTNATFLPDGVEPTIARDSPLRTYMVSCVAGYRGSTQLSLIARPPGLQLPQDCPEHARRGH